MGRLGWRDGSHEVLRGRVLGVLYWFVFRRARDSGYRRVDLGGTPPYLDDGVFRFKSRWNAELVPDRGNYGSYHLLIDPSHPDAIAFLSRCSMIIATPEQGFSVCSATPDQFAALPPRLKAGLAGWVACPSLVEGNGA
jgi:hypothetical protein